MLMAAAIGGGVTAAALLAAGAVQTGDAAATTSASLLGGKGEPATPARPAGGALSAREIYERDGAGRRVRARADAAHRTDAVRRLRDPAQSRRPARASCSTTTG